MSLGSSTTDAMPRRPSAADEAAEWLATLTDSACTAHERQCFVAWLTRSNLHVEEFLRISALTQRLMRPELLPRADIEELVRLATAHLAGASGVTDISARAAATPRAPRQRLLWVLAACTVPAAAILVLLFARFDPPGWLTPTYTTSVGELRSVTLEDGSVVELNTQSRLRTRFSAAERRVELMRGEAVFKVAKNPARPFRVAAGFAEIVAVGTAFNVYAQSSRTVVTVLEGRVRVSDHTSALRPNQRVARSDQNLEVASGEQAIIAPHVPIALASIADPKRATSWTERRLIFDETPLATAAVEFARYNARWIRIRDPKLAQLHITGVFDATDPASLVQFVQAYGEVGVQEDRGGWTLESTGAAARTE
jgi:transmembrane sensor